MSVISGRSYDFQINTTGSLRTKSFPTLLEIESFNQAEQYQIKMSSNKRLTKSDSDLSRNDGLNEKTFISISKSEDCILGNQQSIANNSITSTVNLYSKLLSPDYVTVPIIGYEIIEERERFTVYKLKIENTLTRDCWLVLRRYTDFVRLNNKLKVIFPQVPLNLPKKKIFGDNFSVNFLENRKHALQIYINSIMNNYLLKNCEVVKNFFCLGEPPTYSDNMEECKSIFEAQEETIYHLKYQLESRNNTIIHLQQKLLYEMKQKNKILDLIKKLNTNCPKCSEDIKHHFMDESV